MARTHQHLGVLLRIHTSCHPPYPLLWVRVQDWHYWHVGLKTVDKPCYIFTMRRFLIRRYGFQSLLFSENHDELQCLRRALLKAYMREVWVRTEHFFLPEGHDHQEYGEDSYVRLYNICHVLRLSSQDLRKVTDCCINPSLLEYTIRAMES